SKAKEDTIKVDIYFEILYAHVYYKTAEGLVYGKPALELAEKLNWEKGLAKINYVIGRVQWRLGNFDAARKNHLEALRISTANNYDKFSGSVLVALGQDFADGGRYPEAISYLLKASGKFEAYGEKSELGNVYTLL